MLHREYAKEMKTKFYTKTKIQREFNSFRGELSDLYFPNCGYIFGVTLCITLFYLTFLWFILSNISFHRHNNANKIKLLVIG